MLWRFPALCRQAVVTTWRCVGILDSLDVGLLLTPGRLHEAQPLNEIEVLEEANGAGAVELVRDPVQVPLYSLGVLIRRERLQLFPYPPLILPGHNVPGISPAQRLFVVVEDALGVVSLFRIDLSGSPLDRAP